MLGLRPLSRRLAALALVSAVAPTALRAAPTIQNPGFEAAGAPNGYGAIPNWTQTPNPSGLSNFTYLSGEDTASGNTFFNNGTTPDPTHVAFIQVFGNDPNNSGTGLRVQTLTLQQTLSGFNTTQSYVLTYLENGRAGLPSPLLQVLLDNAVIVASHVDAPVEAANSHTLPFRTVTSIAFTPTSATPTLKFVVSQPANNTDATALIDNVQITQVVPEPASLALLASAALPLLARRRR